MGGGQPHSGARESTGKTRQCRYLHLHVYQNAPRWDGDRSSQSRKPRGNEAGYTNDHHHREPRLCRNRGLLLHSSALWGTGTCSRFAGGCVLLRLLPRHFLTDSNQPRRLALVLFPVFEILLEHPSAGPSMSLGAPETAPWPKRLSAPESGSPAKLTNSFPLTSLSLSLSRWYIIPSTINS